MLDKLFENPSEKLQKFLKWFVVANTILQIIVLAIYQFGRGTFSREFDFKALGAVLVGSVILIVLNYIGGLFLYMLLGYFSDIHDIRDGLEYGILKAYPQDNQEEE